VTQAPVAHRQRLLSQLIHDRPDDAGPGEDDLGALGLQPDDPATRLGVAGSVELDLSVDQSVRFEALFLVPARYANQLLGIALRDDSTAARTTVIRPPAP